MIKENQEKNQEQLIIFGKQNKSEPIEIESPEPIKIETPEPIKIEPKPPIEIDKNEIIRLNSKGFPVLRAKQLPRLNKDHYDSVKLPSQEKDYKGWIEARALRLGASDLAKFTTFHKDIPDLFNERLYGIKKDFSQKSIRSMKAGQRLEADIHEEMALDLFSNGKATLGTFEFSEVYLSKNRQYFNNDLPKLGSQLDAWGVLEGKRTVIEIKSTEHFNFKKIEDALNLVDFELGNTQSVQDLIHEITPYYYYQVQAQLLTTGLKQAVIHIINRNTFEALTVLIKSDLKAFSWIEAIAQRYETILGVYKESQPEDLLKDWEDFELGFDLEIPSPNAKKKAEAEMKEKVIQLVQNSSDIKEGLGELDFLEKQMRSLKAKLTRAGFKDSQRKVWEKVKNDKIEFENNFKKEDNYDSCK